MLYFDLDKEDDPRHVVQPRIIQLQRPVSDVVYNTDDFSYLQRAQQIVVDAMDSLQSDNSDYGEPSVESRAVFSAKINTVAALLGMGDNYQVTTESAYTTKVSLENSADNFFVRIWKALKQMIENLVKWVKEKWNKLMGRSAGQKKRLVAQEVKLEAIKKQPAKDIDKPKQIPNPTIARAFRSKVVTPAIAIGVLAFHRERMTQAMEAIKRIEQVLAGDRILKVDSTDLIQDHNRIIKAILDSLDFKSGSNNTYYLKNLLYGRTIVCKPHVTAGEGIFDSDKTLVSFDIKVYTTTKEEDYKDGVISVKSVMEVYEPLTAAIDAVLKDQHHENLMEKVGRSLEDMVKARFPGELSEDDKQRLHNIKGVAATISKLLRGIIVPIYDAYMETLDVVHHLVNEVIKEYANDF